MTQNLFNQSERKKIISLLMRKLIKESEIRIKPIDPEIHEFILLDIRRRFDFNNRQNNLKKINSLISLSESILEDFKKIKINENNEIIDPSIIECSYIVNIRLIPII